MQLYVIDYTYECDTVRMCLLDIGAVLPATIGPVPAFAEQGGDAALPKTLGTDACDVRRSTCIVILVVFP